MHLMETPGRESWVSGVIQLSASLTYQAEVRADSSGMGRAKQTLS